MCSQFDVQWQCAATCTVSSMTLWNCLKSEDARQIQTTSSWVTMSIEDITLSRQSHYSFAWKYDSKKELLFWGAITKADRLPRSMASMMNAFVNTVMLMFGNIWQTSSTIYPSQLSLKIKSSVYMEVFLQVLTRLIKWEKLIVSRKYRTKDQCVICFGLILTTELDGVFLREELGILSDKTFQTNSFRRMALKQ